ncbi:MAG: dihydrofolate reductase family protein [bacterium]
MRLVALQMGISVDGYVAGGPDDDYDPGPLAEHPDVVARKMAWLHAAGTHIMGRVSYEAMASVWPTATGEYAAPMNDVPKVVFSRTLTRADWPTSRIASGDLAEEIHGLKAEPGGDIIAFGGYTFAQALSRAGLIDEYRLVTRPAALGSGEPMFKDLTTVLHLDLTECNAYPDGTVITVYRAPRCQA